jgi:hypothetical protein
MRDMNAWFSTVIVASVLSITAASPALGQVGVIGGLNLGTVSVSGETEGQTFTLQPGFMAGGFFPVRLPKTKITLRIEALLTTKGVRIAVAGFTESLHIGELEVPVLMTFLAKRTTRTNIRVLAGPSLAGKLFTRSVVNGQRVGEPALTDGEVGLKVGLQFERGTIFYGLSYTHGVSNFVRADDAGAPVDAVKTRTMSVVVGVIFTRGR